jgi:chemotaxis protein histidine kinase CheA
VQERLRTIGGSLVIESETGKGTTVFARVPLRSKFPISRIALRTASGNYRIPPLSPHPYMQPQHRECFACELG